MARWTGLRRPTIRLAPRIATASNHKVGSKAAWALSQQILEHNTEIGPRRFTQSLRNFMGPPPAASQRDTQPAHAVRLPYFFEASGGNFLNIFVTPLSRFSMFLLELVESVSLEAPLQINFLVLVSNKSTITVPTL
jgi:hypothetical protein